MSRRTPVAVLFAIVLIGRGSAALGQPTKTMPLSSSRIFPPVWNKGDRWSVAMKTPAPVPDDLLPSYVEHTFEFRVDAVPDARKSSYRIEVLSHDAGIGGAYALYYRREDFSLEKVTRFYPPETAEQTVLQSGGHPFIYYERRLPIVPDFPIANPAYTSDRREFIVAGNQLIQEVQISGDHARIKLERIEPLGSLCVTMEWTAGNPWWSTIECSENPPEGVDFQGQVVASGRLCVGKWPGEGVAARQEDRGGEGHCAAYGCRPGRGKDSDRRDAAWRALALHFRA